MRRKTIHLDLIYKEVSLGTLNGNASIKKRDQKPAARRSREGVGLYLEGG